MKIALVVRALVLSGVFSGSIVLSQEVPPAESLLDRLFTYAAEYRAKLPSLECRESMTSERLKKGKVTWTVRMEAVLQVTPNPAHAGETIENRRFTSVDGKPPKERWKIPYFVLGGFANIIGFGHPEQRQCFDYALTHVNDGSRLRLEMTAKQDLSTASCTDVFSGFHKVVLIDTDPLRIVRVERWISSDDAKRYKEPFYYAMDYGEQSFGPQILWLPVRAESHDAKGEGRLEILYSNYHRFAAETRILPGTDAEGQSR